MQKLPLSLSTFRELRESNYLYVDKTKYAHELITGDRRYFLSRPRRFGKSLFISTLKEILLGNKDLFNNLWIEKSDYQWKYHAVISLSLSSLDIDNLPIFKKSLMRALRKISEQYSIDSLDFEVTPKALFIDLIEALHKKFGRVAILVDEYDYPILRILDNSAYAIEIRDTLDEDSTLYKLDYPNEEVRVSFQKYLLEIFAKLDLAESERMAQTLRIALNNHNIEEAVSLIQQFFAHGKASI